MGYLKTVDLDRIKSDVAKGLRQGVVAVKRGVMVVRKKAGELTDEGKRQYKILSLKTKVHEGITDLGARVYSIMRKRGKNPALDPKVKDIAAQIKRYEAEITLLEKEQARGTKRIIRKAA